MGDGDGDGVLLEGELAWCNGAAHTALKGYIIKDCGL